MSKTKLISIGLIILSFALGIYFYPQMPLQMASHWNISGNVNGYMPKFLGLFLLPLILLVIFIVFNIIPKIDPKKQNITKFRNQYDIFINILLGFLFYIYLLTIIWNLGIKFNFGQLLSPAFAVLLYFIGILMEKAQPNWFIGIRTPWTLTNEKVWVKTHKLGAKLFKICSFLSLLGILIPGLSFWLILVPIITVTISVFIYSYIIFSRYEKKSVAK